MTAVSYPFLYPEGYDTAVTPCLQPKNIRFTVVFLPHSCRNCVAEPVVTKQFQPLWMQPAGPRAERAASEQWVQCQRLLQQSHLPLLSTSHHSGS